MGVRAWWLQLCHFRGHTVIDKGLDFMNLRILCKLCLKASSSSVTVSL